MKHSETQNLWRGAVQPFVLWGIIIIVMGGAMIGWNYYITHQFRGEEKVPKIENLRGRNLPVIDHRGNETSLFEIAAQGKPWVLGTFYTRCPQQCSGVAGNLLALDNKIGAGKVNFVLLSFDPVRDRPEILQEWAKSFGLDHENWYLVTVPEGVSEEVVFDYLEGTLKMSRPVWRKNEDGSIDYGREPEHPTNVLLLTDNDIRGSEPVGENQVTGAMLRQSLNRLEKKLLQLLEEQE